MLWDLEQRKELWRGNSGQFEPSPLANWTSDSQKVAFWSTDRWNDIQLLNRDGNSYSMVRTPIFPLRSQNLSIGSSGFSWAPDNRFLAIGGAIKDDLKSSQTPVLYVYDLLDETFIYRCPAGEATDWVYIGDVFWSPDGIMLIPEHISNELDKTPLLIYDIKDKTVYQIGQIVYTAFGWVREFSAKWK